MNSQSMLFSHQQEIASELSKYFKHTYVVTSGPDFGSATKNVSIFSTNWSEGKHIRSVLRLYFHAIPILLRYRKDSVVFFHMVDVQAFLLTGICKLLGIRNYLWYAHKTSSVYLKVAAPFLTGIFTSTRGSCPLKGNKVIAIGQAVRTKSDNDSIPLASAKPNDWYHVGRLDPSKNLEDIISVLEDFRKEYPDIKLTIYGKASSRSTEEYASRLIQKYSANGYPDWLTFYGELQHSQLSNLSLQHDGFIHAYQGSLDKTLVEAAMLKRVIVSANPEFSLEFEGRDQGKYENVQNILRLKLERIYNLNAESRLELINRNYELAVSEHSTDVWLGRLIVELKGLNK